jgi:DnaD/phage-associated family protein
MSIVRVRKRENPFVQIDRSVFENSSLSWKAKGILGYLLSKPDNWKTYVSDIEKKAKDGRDSVRSGLKELEACGYVRKIRVRDENGKFVGWEYEVFEIPTEVGFTENGKSEVGKSEFGEPDTSNNKSSNNYKSNNYLLAEVYHFYQNNFGVLPSMIGEEIAQWIDDLSAELVIEAMKRALEQNKRTWKYVKGILRDWAQKGVKSLDDVNALDAEWKSKKEKKEKPSTQSYYQELSKDDFLF